jgi:hypothetical protein
MCNATWYTLPATFETDAYPQSKQARAESPTTARELDFDDDNETPAVTENKPSPPPPSKSPKPGVRFSESATEIPPPKPPRPVNRMEQDAKALADMFPDTDAKVIKAVLVASGGDVERAMNALLSMETPVRCMQQRTDGSRHERPQLHCR